MSRGSSGWKSRARRFADLLAANGNIKSELVDIEIPENLGVADTPTFKNLVLHETDNATGCQVQFSDQDNGDQKGFIEYVHANSQSDGAGNAFKFHSTESSLNVLVDGNVKADAFVGDGSGLTNLPATAASGTLGPVQYSGWSNWHTYNKSSGDFDGVGAGDHIGNGPVSTYWGSSATNATSTVDITYSSASYQVGSESTSTTITVGWEFYVHHENANSDYRRYRYYKRRMYRTIS
jgi:hypothetical protein